MRHSYRALSYDDWTIAIVKLGVGDVWAERIVKRAMNNFILSNYKSFLLYDDNNLHSYAG
jgi:hypothetical protein